MNEKEERLKEPVGLDVPKDREGKERIQKQAVALLKEALEAAENGELEYVSLQYAAGDSLHFSCSSVSAENVIEMLGRHALSILEK